jgi:multidrug efflux system outer membrane protein
MSRLARLSFAAFAVVGASLLAGCTVGKNYERPQLPNPATYRFVEGATEAQSLADTPWWQVFDDPTLQALVREALVNNLDLQMAVARVEEARARAGIAKSFLYPQVDGAVSYGVRQASTARTQAGADDDTTHQSGAYGFQLSWEIDLFGRLRRQHEASLALVLASEQGRRGVLVTLVGDVATNYFLLRELDLQLEIARQTLRLNNETVTYFRNRLEAASRTGSNLTAFRPTRR